MIKTRLNVLKEDEPAVLMLGGKYDGRMKCWYVPQNLSIIEFSRYIPLSIELIPASTWEKNVRSERKNEWDLIRKKTYKLNNHTCEICGANKEMMESHESWSFDFKTKIQKLISLHCYCHMCHRTKHYGLASLLGEEKMVNAHILKINNWKMEDLNKYLDEVLTQFNERSSVLWQLDLSYLDNY